MCALALPANIRLGWKGLPGANTPSYYDTATITAVKGFIGLVCPNFLLILRDQKILRL